MRRARRLDHVAIAVRDTEAALPFYRDRLGLPFHSTEELESPPVRLTYLDAGNAFLQLVEPLDDASPLAEALATRGEGLHHVCFGVDDVADTVAALSDPGTVLRTGSGRGRPSAFVTSAETSGALIECTRFERSLDVDASPGALEVPRAEAEPGGRPPWVVLDDDPTGVQTLAGARVLLDWDDRSLAAELARSSAVHLVTNSRALEPGQALVAVEQAARAALRSQPNARIVLRGDSTLRAHLVEEYLGVRAALATPGWPALLLSPALPSAGRTTVEGIQLLERDGTRIPLDRTEFARDGGFAYPSARLLEWAEHRSRGLFPAHAGREISLGALREGGEAAVAEALRALGAEDGPAVLSVDSVTEADLALVARGYAIAVDGGANVLVRCSPALAGALSGTQAVGLAPLPSAGEGILVVCGSYVEATTRQLAALAALYPGRLVEADVGGLTSDDPGPEVERLASATDQLLRTQGLAVLATPRERPRTAMSLAAGSRVAAGLAHVVASLETRPSVLVTKGGVTSAVVIREGVGARACDVIGPVAPGISRWAGTFAGGGPVDLLVVPGNVGDENLLARLVDAVRAGATSC